METNSATTYLYMVCSDQKRLNFELINKLNKQMKRFKILKSYTLYTLLSLVFVPNNKI